MRMQYVQVWTEQEMGRDIAKQLAKSGLSKITWFRVSDTVVVCHGFDSVGRDRIGSCSFRHAGDFDAVVACKLSLFDASIKGDGYDTTSSRGAESFMEAV